MPTQTFDSQFQIGWKEMAATIGIPTVAGVITYLIWKRETISSGLARSDFLQSKIVVPGDKVGAVIGKGGSVVREIEQKSGARVRVVATPPNPASNGTFEEEKDGVVVIQGHRENVLTAELAVRKVIAQTAPVLTEDVFAPKESIGFIIGKKGQSIRELSYVSGAKVTIGRTGNDSEVITIRGRPQSIDAAKMWLEKKVNESKELREKRERAKPVQQESKIPDDEVTFENTATEVTIEEKTESTSSDISFGKNGCRKQDKGSADGCEIWD